MKKAIIETWYSKGGVIGMCMNQAGLAKFKESLSELEKEKEAIVLDDESFHLELTLDDNLSKTEKKERKLAPTLLTIFGITFYLAILGLTALGVVYLYELLNT